MRSVLAQPSTRHAATIPISESARAKRMPHIPSAAAPILLTPIAVLILGYHPFAGDAGIYVAGIRHILNPSLYPLNSVFVTAYSRLSVFSWTVAALVRLSHLPLSWILFALQLLSVFVFLWACRALATRLFSGESARWCSTLLAAAAAGLPIAGTALVLMDPYVTARSFSTPLGILAVVAALDRAPGRAALLALLAVLIHPLMGAWIVAFVVLYLCVSSHRTALALTLCIVAFAACGLVFAWAHGLPISPAYRQAVALAPRSFLFLSRWRWYEILGLVFPLLLFVIAFSRSPRSAPQSALCLTSILLGVTTTLIAALSVPAAGPYPLVPLQVLRSFHLIYAVGLVLLGGAAGSLALRSPAATAALLFTLFAGMYAAQRVTWSGSGQIEWPGVPPANSYAQAFLWIRGHTPPAAVFAFDPDLVYQPGEDEQGFRAIAERDHLADDKDAGIAAVLPRLAPRWSRQRNAEFSINHMTDAERLQALRRLGATWLLLPPGAHTKFPCPYRDAAVQVCPLRSPNSFALQKRTAQVP